MTWLADHWLDVLGWGGSALLVFSLLQTRVLRFRVLNLAACLILLLFNALIQVWPMVGMNAVLCSINVFFIVRLMRERHDASKFTVLRVRADDVYLRHVLATHAADIRRHQPDLDPTAWQAASDGRAYLVQHGDETVGVVLLHPDGDTARVELDWVTPRYRDFSPGEFVWRESDLLVQEGFRRVVTPPNMVGAYYERLGFHREGEAWARELEAA
jgi:hypothetical protein